MIYRYFGYQSMDKYALIAFIALGTGLYTVTDAAADATFRCSNRVVGIGNSVLQVLAKCAAPDRIDRWQAYPNAYVFKRYNYEKQRHQAPLLVKGPISMERWTYHLGSPRFVRHLIFENQRLIRIETGAKTVQ
jgi:hypothetical protein